MQDRDKEEADDGEDGRWSVEVAESDGGGRAGDDDARVAESDEGDEETDASADCGVELMRDCCEEALADTRVRECEEDGAGEEDGAEGRLPGDVHGFDDGVGEVGVEAHAGSEGEWIVGERAHEDAAEGRAEAGGGRDGGEGHTGLGEDRRVDEDDVSHGDESGEACEDLRAPVGGVDGEAEVVFETGADGGQERLLQLACWLE